MHPKLKISKSKCLVTCLGIGLLLGPMCSFVCAQNTKKLMRDANESFSFENYGAALPVYLQVLESDPENLDASFYAGVCYLRTLYRRRALPFLLKVYQKNPAIDPKIEYLLGEAYQCNNQFDQAIVLYDLYKKNYRGKAPDEMAMVDRKIKECRNGLTYIKNPVHVVIKNFGQEVNGPFPDYAPVISSNESVMFFTSRREGSTGGFLAPEDGLPYEDIYVTFHVNGKWSAARNVGAAINTPGHDACIAVSPNGKQLFIYKDTHSGDIYSSSLIDSVTYQWSQPTSLGNNVNTKYQEPSISMTADGKTIFFSSDRPGGMGGLDIYISHKGSDGQWGEAVNLGAPINTPEDDDAPFIHPDGQTLYFSSRGHATMGGYDIFRCYLENDTWTEPENLGFPINTADENTYFVLTADNRHGYYASVNEEGYGEKDIYVLSMPNFDSEAMAKGRNVKVAKVDPTLSQKPVTVLTGIISDALTKAPLEARVVLTDNERNEVFSELTSNSSTGRYTVNIPSGRNYGLSVEKKGYLFHSENYNVPPSIGYREMTLDIALKRSIAGSKIILKNIFFDFDKATLRTESTAELQHVITLLNDSPELKIIISGHTDNVGTDDYNQGLSERRAKAVIDYLIAKGIHSRRLNYKGYGSQRPVAENTTYEGRQLNRRTEFEVAGN
jgi:outer membrane protein OmpA-like peptidoglycan-associated protein/tetratricopeptide (TPR) repeat protein